MKKTTTQTFHSLLKLTSLALLLYMCFLLGACSNKSKKSKKEDQSTDTSLSKGKYDENSIVLNSHYLSADTLRQLFNRDNNVKQLVFDIKHLGKDGWGFTVVGADKKGKTITGPFLLPIIPNTKVPMATGSAIGSQKVTRGDLKKFFALTSLLGRDSIMDDAVFQNIRITPSTVLGKNFANLFIMTKMPATPIAPFNANGSGQIITQPSPEGRACGDSCDIGS